MINDQSANAVATNSTDPPPAANKATRSLGGPEQSKRPRRVRRLGLLIGLFSLPALTAFYYAFCNVAMHSENWTHEQIDPAIQRGLDYLESAGTFGKAVDDGGETPPHFLFLEEVLKRYDHPGLSAQITRAQELNKSNQRWRMFFGMPGWPHEALTQQDYANIAHTVNHWKENFWAEWLLHGLYPAWTHLRPEEDIRLFQDTSRLRDSYQMTHALLTYLWIKKTNPSVAKERDVDRLITEVNARLWTIQCWDAFTSDIYNERVAFWFYMDRPPSMKRRWIERILLSQNGDGGWTYDKSPGRLLGQFVGWDPGTAPSSPHATFLALYALSEYKSKMAHE